MSSDKVSETPNTEVEEGEVVQEEHRFSQGDIDRAVYFNNAVHRIMGRVTDAAMQLEQLHFYKDDENTAVRQTNEHVAVRMNIQSACQVLYDAEKILWIAYSTQRKFIRDNAQVNDDEEYNVD